MPGCPCCQIGHCPEDAEGVRIHRFADRYIACIQHQPMSPKREGVRHRSISLDPPPIFGAVLVNPPLVVRTLLTRLPVQLSTEMGLAQGNT